MKRREFITLLGGAAAWPLAARAQQPHRIGVLLGFEATDPDADRLLAAFKNGLQEFGWIEGRNIAFDYRWPAADPERIRTYAVELAASKPSVILVNSTPATRILHRETRTVPVVFVNIADPIRSGVVASLANPGGNLTGLSNFEPRMGGKWLELLKEIAPKRTRVGLLFNPDTHSGQYSRLLEDAAPTVGMQSIQLLVRAAAELEGAIASVAADSTVAIMVVPDTFNFVHRDRIVALAAQHRVPAIYPYRFFVAGGGLISYGFDDADLYRRAASYVDRILRGTKPADLPVQLPTKFELAINLKAAKALGLDVPDKLLAVADEVIE